MVLPSHAILHDLKGSKMTNEKLMLAGLERYMLEIGLLPQNATDALPDLKEDTRHLCLVKGYFNDSRDSLGGVVPF